MRFRPHPTSIRAQYLQLRETAAFKRWRERQRRRQFGRCAYCFGSLRVRGEHCDHVRAVAVGGSNGYWNFVLACAPCNLEKSAQVLTRPYEWLVRLRLVPLILLYESWALLVLFIQAFYTVPKR